MHYYALVITYVHTKLTYKLQTYIATLLQICNCKQNIIMYIFTKLQCLDVNECARDHGCHHLCNNTDGSFHCYCNPGYMLHSNGINCTGWS